MRRLIISLIAFVLSIQAFAQEEEKQSLIDFSIPIKNWEMRIVTSDHLFPTYLADPLGVRFEISSQKILFSDIDYQDELNEGGSYIGKMVIHPGVRLSLFRFSPRHNPKLGIEADLGMDVQTFMRGGNHDLIGIDGIYYFAIAARPYEWLSLRFTKHHICTHVGDEYNQGSSKTPTDIDPNITQLPVRDDFILSAAITPLHFTELKQKELVRLYAEIGTFWPGVDFLGTRQNKPSAHAWLNYQFGAEVEYYFSKTYLGGLYAAANISAYQSNAFAPNLSVTGGYLFPQTMYKKRLRIGFNYYNGRNLLNQFQHRKEKYIAFTVGTDI